MKGEVATRPNATKDVEAMSVQTDAEAIVKALEVISNLASIYKMLPFTNSEIHF